MRFASNINISIVDNENSMTTTFNTVEYTPNGNSSSEIHQVNKTLNVKYFQNIDLFHDIDKFVNYQEINATSGLWPNYIPELRSCDPDLPNFILNTTYVIKLAESSPENLTFTAYEDGTNSIFLFRVGSNKPSNNVAGITPSWVSFNETSGVFTISTSKVKSVQIVDLVFQAQLMGYSMQNNYVNNTITTSISSFSFNNENGVFLETELSWYVIIQQVKNFSLSFNDKEGDSVLLRQIKSGNVNLFKQMITKTSYSVLVMANDDTVTETAVILAFTDAYHQDSQYWTEIKINVNVFKTEPPVFENKPNDINVNLGQPQQLYFEFPRIIDPDSFIFSVLFTNNPPDWVKIVTQNNTSSYSVQSFYVRFLFLILIKILIFIEVYVKT